MIETKRGVKNVWKMCDVDAVLCRSTQLLKDGFDGDNTTEEDGEGGGGAEERRASSADDPETSAGEHTAHTNA